MTKEKIFFQTTGSKVLAELTKTPYPGEAVLQKALADARGHSRIQHDRGPAGPAAADQEGDGGPSRRQFRDTSDRSSVRQRYGCSRPG